GSPGEIYDRPANTFVAGFIGSPAMNLLTGRFEAGTFRAEGVRIDGLAAAAAGEVTLGFRAEDARIADPTAAAIAAPIYSVELLGDATMVTVRAGGALVAVKTAKSYRAAIGDRVGIAIDPAQCHLFDAPSGRRIDHSTHH
ncbi:MAG: TOBE domain-containing protein, partial [Alphaproteobacteria bacterium]|nr:TOBE domain-containing protein [Alphaproteobacteria bacterium]